jgi:hypothetical protein
MSDDDLVEGAQQQFKTLAAARRRAEADLAEAQVQGDTASIAEELQTIANLDMAAQNLTSLARRYAQANQPPAAPPPDAWKTKRVEEMTSQDAFNMIRETSRYGKNMTVDEFNQGHAKLQQAKARGDYSGKP